MKVILFKIKTCADCPHCDHTSLLGKNPMRICLLSNKKTICKVNTRMRDVPKWCPLPEFTE